MFGVKILASAGAALAAIAFASLAQAQQPQASTENPDIEAGGGDAIIVTGTRQTGLRAADSAAPVQVVGAEVLARVGQPNLNQALNQIVPSFTAQAFGGDASNLTLTARLRGLSPNHALILINGKRRHPSANFHVTAGPFQGGFAPDLDLISPAAIERIEVLTDGAAAQYGSDAIAGVINIILKQDKNGGSLSVTGGRTYDFGGDTVASTARLAQSLGDNGFVSATVSYRYQDFAIQGGGERRVADINGNPVSVAPTASNPGYPLSGYPLTGASDWPQVNPILSTTRSHLTTALVNAGYNFGGVEAYVNGTFARRIGLAKEQYRPPNVLFRVNDGRALQNGEVLSNGFIVRYPYGFVPLMKLTEEDVGLSGGLRGDLGGWRWDLSGTYGRDKVALQTVSSGNVNLYQDYGYTPSDFDTGGFIGTQFTLNLDIARELDVGLAKPLNLAFGAERRYDSYQIVAGEPASYYRTGAQSFPGFQPSSAGKNSRKSWSAYVELTAYPVEQWSIGVAGRYENYTDFGNTTIGKITTRYDVSEAFALRGTASKGFRAPSLGESYYSAIGVSPTSETVQIAANSAAARLLGYTGLQAEKSTNFSVGLVAHPVPGITVTLDAYQIEVKDRIASSGTIPGLIGFAVVNQAVLNAIASIGREYDKTVPQVGISTFTNAFDTRTRGADLVVTTRTDAGFGHIDWSLTATYGETKVTNVKIAASAFTPTSRSYIESANPKYKVGFGALLTSGRFRANLRETIYGPAYALFSPTGTTYYEARIGAAAITDLELAYEPADGLELAIGANNLFNHKPPKVPRVPGSSDTNPTYINGSQVHDTPINFAAYGITGGYYYARLSAKF